MDEVLDVLDVFRGRLTVGREAKGVDGEVAEDIEVARVRDAVVVVVGVWVVEVEGLVEEEVVDIVVVVGFVGTREGRRSIEQ